LRIYKHSFTDYPESWMWGSYVERENGMRSKKQFINLASQQTLHDYDEYLVQQPTTPLPTGVPACDFALSDWQGSTKDAEDAAQNFPAVVPAENAVLSRKNRLLRGIAVALCLLAAVALFTVWRTTMPSAASSVVSQQNLSNTASLQSTSIAPTSSSSSTNSNSNTDTIQVYVLGDVKHPGVYSLPTDARVYQLLQAAGGPLPNADLVSLDLAAKLSDGQEVYVLKMGETAPANLALATPSTSSSSGSSNTTNSGSGNPTSPGLPININTATATEMRTALHVSSVTAQKIITYRTQHGSYTSIDQLLQVISKSIYNRIKSMVTV
jgi:competence protein ComEA